MVLLLLGCSTAPVIIEHNIPVHFPAIKDTVTLKDTIIAIDSVWYSQLRDSMNQVVGDLTVYYKTKIASINIKPKVIYVTVTDTLPCPDTADTLLPVAVGMFNWWEKGILAGGIGLLLGLIIYLRSLRGKIL